MHTRRLADPEAAFERLLPALERAGRPHDLVVEPGRQVVEVRSPGMHKGIVVERLVDELDAGGFVFVGDDLGDLEAFEAVAALRERRSAHPAGLLGLRRGERPGPARRRLVHGPEGVLDLLRQLPATPEAEVARNPLGIP